MVVSVVIPAYNAARFVERTLETVRVQTFTGHETIIVDDGSIDGTADVAQAFLTRHAMHGRVVRQQNGGVAAARNAGIRAAAGTYVALLDSDDLWYSGKLAEVMAEFARQPDADLICHDETLTRDGRVIRVSRRKLPGGNAYEALLFGGNFLSPSATMLRRDAVLAVGGFNERRDYATVEDYDFWLRFARERQIRVLPKVLGEYVMSEHSASRRIVSHHVALEQMLQDHLTAYLGSHRNLSTRWRARRRLAQVYRSAARQLIEHREAAQDQKTYVGRMLRTYPLELRNVAVALLWTVGVWRRRSEALPS